MSPDAGVAAKAWRLVLPSHPLAGRLGDRLGRGTGSSLEFMDYRDYVPGDDLRHVDWRAYARTDQLKVRLFREETAPSLDVVVDTSASMGVSPRKEAATRDLAAVAAALSRQAGGHARVLAAGGDPVDDVRRLRVGGEDAVDLRPRAPLRTRALRMLVSDFLVPEDPRPRIQRLAAGSSHLYVLQLLDPWEADPGAEGETTLIDTESEERADLVLDAKTVKGYRERLTRLQEAVAAATRAVGGTFAVVLADAPGAMLRSSLLPQRVVEPA